MKMAGKVFLDAEEQFGGLAVGPADDFVGAGWLRCFLEVAFRLVLIESHGLGATVRQVRRCERAGGAGGAGGAIGARVRKVRRTCRTPRTHRTPRTLPS